MPRFVIAIEIDNPLKRIDSPVINVTFDVDELMSGQLARINSEAPGIPCSQLSVKALSIDSGSTAPLIKVRFNGSRLIRLTKQSVSN